MGIRSLFKKPTGICPICMEPIGCKKSVTTRIRYMGTEYELTGSALCCDECGYKKFLTGTVRLTALEPEEEPENPAGTMPEPVQEPAQPEEKQKITFVPKTERDKRNHPGSGMAPEAQGHAGSGTGTAEPAHPGPAGEAKNTGTEEPSGDGRAAGQTAQETDGSREDDIPEPALKKPSGTPEPEGKNGTEPDRECMEAGKEDASSLPQDMPAAPVPPVAENHVHGMKGGQEGHKDAGPGAPVPDAGNAAVTEKTTGSEAAPPCMIQEENQEDAPDPRAGIPADSRDRAPHRTMEEPQAQPASRNAAKPEGNRDGQKPAVKKMPENQQKTLSAKTGTKEGQAATDHIPLRAGSVPRKNPPAALTGQPILGGNMKTADPRDRADRENRQKTPAPAQRQEKTDIKTPKNAIRKNRDEDRMENRPGSMPGEPHRDTREAGTRTARQGAEPDRSRKPEPEQAAPHPKGYVEKGNGPFGRASNPFSRDTVNDRAEGLKARPRPEAPERKGNPEAARRGTGNGNPGQVPGTDQGQKDKNAGNNRPVERKPDRTAPSVMGTGMPEAADPGTDTAGRPSAGTPAADTAAEKETAAARTEGKAPLHAAEEESRKPAAETLQEERPEPEEEPAGKTKPQEAPKETPKEGPAQPEKETQAGQPEKEDGNPGNADEGLEDPDGGTEKKGETEEKKEAPKGGFINKDAIERRIMDGLDKIDGKVPQEVVDAIPIINVVAKKKRMSIFNREEEHYLKNHIPHKKVILSDKLYDTDSSTMFLRAEGSFGFDRPCVHYNYRTQNGNFFSCTVRYKEEDMVRELEELEVKQMLKDYPDIYCEFFGNDIKQA